MVIVFLYLYVTYSGNAEHGIGFGAEFPLYVVREFGLIIIGIVNRLEVISPTSKVTSRVGKTVS